MMGKAQAVEQVQKVIGRLTEAGEPGKKALSMLQASAMLDLIDAGFSTQSLKIGNNIVFNPVPFRNRLKAIGPEKLAAVFKDKPDVLKKLSNMDKIALDLIPPATAVPKGSASTILDLMESLGFSKIVAVAGATGGPVVAGATKAAGEISKGVSGTMKTKRMVREALDATPEITDAIRLPGINELISDVFPGIATALSIPTAQETQR
jgi:hypothetical protein